MDAVILAGGLGTRLRKVISDVPKPLAPINGRPFLEILLDQMRSFQKFQRVILATGYLSNQIEHYFASHTYPFTLLFSKEMSPLGTGGALKQALQHVTSSQVFVFNGDSFFDIDFEKMWQTHQMQQADITIACRHVDDVSRYGEIMMHQHGQIYAFKEKTHLAHPGWINGGIYLMQLPLDLPSDPVFSLEHHLFPALLNNRLFGYCSAGKFIDIGTQESYYQAQELLI